MDKIDMKTISLSKTFFEISGFPNATEFALRNDADSITKKLSLLH